MGIGDCSLSCSLTILVFMLMSPPISQGADAPNLPPQVSIVWPPRCAVRDYSLSGGTIVKIKTEAFDPDGAIAEVRVYVGTNLVGIARTPPFDVILVANTAEGLSDVKAVAIDNLGAASEFASVTVMVVSGAPPDSFVNIVAPKSGTLLALEPFAFTAEVLWCYGELAPVEFYVGTNRVGTVAQQGFLSATTPPATVVVSNLDVGEYNLTVRYQGTIGDFCGWCLDFTNRIRIVDLGAQVLPVRWGEPFRFDVVTAYTNRPHVVERSGDLHNWLPVETNTPLTSRYPFTESVLLPPSDTGRFYRVVVP